MVAAVGPGQRRLLVAGHGADHGRAQRGGPLADDQPDAAGRGVYQYRVARPDLVDVADQIARGHALQHHRRRGAVVDRVRQLDHPVRSDQPGFGIGADGRCVGDPVARFQMGDAGADRIDDTRRLHARHERQRQRVEAGAVIDIDVVQPDCGLLQPDLAGTRLADLDLVPLQHFGTAGLMDSDRV